jgi:hypothetical protein
MDVERRRNFVQPFTHPSLRRPFDVKADDNADADRCEERHRGGREPGTEKAAIVEIEDSEAHADQQEGERPRLRTARISCAGVRAERILDVSLRIKLDRSMLFDAGWTAGVPPCTGSIGPLPSIKHMNIIAP